MLARVRQRSRRLQKNMWYGIMKEFECKASSTWSVCGKLRAGAFTHRHLGQDKKEVLSQLDCIIGPMRRNDEIYIHNAGRLWATWDHYPIFARIHEERHVKAFQKRHKKWTGWKPTTEEQLFFKKGGDEKTKAIRKKISRLCRRTSRTRPRKCNTERKHRRKEK